MDAFSRGISVKQVRADADCVPASQRLERLASGSALEPVINFY